MLMPTGNEEVWMVRIRDRGKVYKIDLLDLLKKAGVKTDAWGQELPDTYGQPAVETSVGRQVKKSKKTKSDETETD